MFSAHLPGPVTSPTQTAAETASPAGAQVRLVPTTTTQDQRTRRFPAERGNDVSPFWRLAEK